MNANAYIKRVAPSATSSACFALFVFRRRARYSAANENSTKMRGVKAGGEGEGGGGDKELALNETRSVFYSFNTTPMKGLNFSSRRHFPRKVIMH